MKEFFETLQKYPDAELAYIKSYIMAILSGDGDARMLLETLAKDFDWREK